MLSKNPGGDIEQGLDKTDYEMGSALGTIHGEHPTNIVPCSYSFHALSAIGDPSKIIAAHLAADTASRETSSSTFIGGRAETRDII